MRTSIGPRSFRQGVWAGAIVALVLAGAAHLGLEGYEARQAEAAQEQLRQNAAEFRRQAEDFQKLTEALEANARQTDPHTHQP